MRAFFACCLLSTLSVPSFASAPPSYARHDITTGFRYLYGMAVGDFNGDGKPDIAATDDYAKDVYIYLNDGHGGFGTPTAIPITMTALGPGSLFAGDFNEDGKQDLIVATVAGIQADILLAGNGDGTFTQRQDLPGSYGFSSATAADINQDQHLDVIFGGNGPIFVYLGDGRGNFQQQNFSNQGNSGLFTAVVTADFNMDRKLDLIVASPIPTAGIRYYPGNGDGTFSPATMVTSESLYQPTSLATADFNADGKPDLLVGSSSVAAIIPGSGDGTFNTTKLSYLSTPAGNNNTNPYPPLVAAVDVNGDHKVDAVVSDDFSRTISVFLNDGTGEFLQSAPDFSSSIDSGVSQLAVVDLNGDSIPDMVVSSNITQNISVFLSTKAKATPNISLTSNSASQFFGSSVDFIGTVSGTAPAPTGTLSLVEGSTSLGQQILDANGRAVLSVSNLSAAQHTLTAVYSGDSNYASGTSSSLVQTVTDMQIAFSTASQTVSAGGTAAYTFSITPAAGLSGLATLTCSQLPALTTCDPVTVTLAGQPVSATLKVHTTAPLRSQSSKSRFAFTLLPLCMLFKPKRRRATTIMTAFSTFCILGISLAGCSSGSISSPGTPLTTPGTPLGASTFTVTATVTQGGQTLTRSTTANLVVQ